MNIENALKIDGWMTPEELEWLAEQASTRKYIAEVGSWMGRSTRAMADNTKGIIFAIDTWKGTPGPNECAELLKERSEDWLYQEFIRNLMPYTNPTQTYLRTVVPLQSPSVVQANSFLRDAGRSVRGEGQQIEIKPWRFDMIFIDAAHDYDNVLADCKAWLPLLAPGGLMCGHDFGGSFPGVARAVREVFPKANKVGAGSIWSANL